LLLAACGFQDGVTHRGNEATEPSPPVESSLFIELSLTVDEDVTDPGLTAGRSLLVSNPVNGDADGALSHVIAPVATNEQPFRIRGTSPDRLVIPSIGLDVRVVPLGTHVDRSGNLVWDTAPFAVGHHQGTAMPGEAGNVVLSGHISSPNEGSVFQKLPSVRAQDGIVVITAQQPYLYRVSDIRVLAPDAVQVLEPTASPVLTLITCVPDGVYSHRLVVRAEAV